MNKQKNSISQNPSSGFLGRMEHRMRGFVNCRSWLGEKNTASEEIVWIIDRRLNSSPDEKDVFPLRLAREGDCVRIVSLNGRRGFHDRLAGIGLGTGVELEVIRNSKCGRMLIGRNGTRLYLGGGMAQKIYVKIINGGKQ